MQVCIRRAATLLLVLCAACEPTAPGSPKHASADALRLVTLAPHLTELVFSAGAGDHLVGVVEYSDHPDAARKLPRIGDAFAVDFERLTELSPTLILAWQGGNPDPLIETLRARGFRVEALAAGDLADVAANLRAIGRLAGTENQAEAAAADFERELSQLSARYADAADVRVFFQIAEQPVFTVGGRHLISQVLRLCGGDNVFSALEPLAATVTDESVVAADAEVMMTAGDKSGLDRWSRFAGRAQRAGTIYEISADTITRDSLRVLDGAREVCAALDDARNRLAGVGR